MPPRNFLTLPYELRHQIYRDYFTLSDGYVFQPESGKLATADGQPLDLSLIYTCLFIASEAKNLPLIFNKISFSTFYHPEWCAWAGRFDYLLHAQIRQRNYLVYYLGPFITPEMMSQVAAKYPWFVPQLGSVIRDRMGWGLHKVHATFHTWRLSKTLRGDLDHRFGYGYPSESALSQAVDFTLRLLAQSSDKQLARVIAKTVGLWQGCRGLDDFLDQCYEPWNIPSWASLDAMGRRFKDDQLWSTMGRCYRNMQKANEYPCKFRFSATAVALRFLNHLSSEKRLCIRNLIIREDHVAVGHPECHSLGLIPLCKENSRLRVDLRVSMIANVYQKSVDSNLGSFDVERYVTHNAGQTVVDEAIGNIFIPLAEWLTEALSLTDAGMPAGSYTLTLDGESVIDLCSDIFQRAVLQRVAMQEALEICFPYPPGRLRKDIFHALRGKDIEAFEHLVNQTSFLQSSFHPGQMWDVDKLIADRSRYDIEKWFEDFQENHLYDFSASIYIPLLRALLAENYERRPCLRHPKVKRRRGSLVRDDYDWLNAT